MSAPPSRASIDASTPMAFTGAGALLIFERDLAAADFAFRGQEIERKGAALRLALAPRLQRQARRRERLGPLGEEPRISVGRDARDEPGEIGQPRGVETDLNPASLMRRLARRLDRGAAEVGDRKPVQFEIVVGAVRFQRERTAFDRRFAGPARCAAAPLSTRATDRSRRTKTRSRKGPAPSSISSASELKSTKRRPRAPSSGWVNATEPSNCVRSSFSVRLRTEKPTLFASSSPLADISA